jgi:Lrp/AsnC family leucine-responsive transcriptional regulator
MEAPMATELRQNGRVTEVDSINAQRLAELQEDARLSVAELGRRVGLSSPAVAERIQRLEETGVIRGYHADVDPRALGWSLTAVIRIRPAPRELKKVADLARATPEVVDCRRMTGEDCYILTAHLRDVEHLEQVIDQFTPYGVTTTSIVQSAPVARRAVAVPEG